MLMGVPSPTQYLQPNSNNLLSDNATRQEHPCDPCHAHTRTYTRPAARFPLEGWRESAAASKASTKFSTYSQSSFASARPTGTRVAPKGAKLAMRGKWRSSCSE